MSVDAKRWNCPRKDAVVILWFMVGSEVNFMRFFFGGISLIYLDCPKNHFFFLLAHLWDVTPDISFIPKLPPLFKSLQCGEMFAFNISVNYG